MYFVFDSFYNHNLIWFFTYIQTIRSMGNAMGFNVMIYLTFPIRLRESMLLEDTTHCGTSSLLSASFQSESLSVLDLLTFLVSLEKLEVYSPSEWDWLWEGLLRRLPRQELQQRSEVERLDLELQPLFLNRKISEALFFIGVFVQFIVQWFPNINLVP